MVVLEEIATLTDTKLDDQYLSIAAETEVEGGTRPGWMGSFGSVAEDRIAGKESLASLGEEGMIGFAVLVGLIRESSVKNRRYRRTRLLVILLLAAARWSYSYRLAAR